MKSKNLLKYFVALILFTTYFSCNHSRSNTSKPDIKIDSISHWIQNSRNKSLSLEKRKSFLHKAYIQNKTINNDSLKVRNFSSIAYRFYAIKDTTTFKKINAEALRIALKTKDTFAIGDLNWNYGDYYASTETYNKSYHHFSVAYNYFNNAYKEESAKMLMYMAFIKGRYRDYTGSEVLLIQAIKRFKELEDYRQLYNVYNDLAILQNDIQEYDRGLEYHKIALSYLNKLDNKRNNYAISLNNIGSTNLKKGDFKEAIKYFNLALKNNNEIENHARILDNRAFSKLNLGDTSNVRIELLRSLEIRDSINDRAGISYSKIHLSKYYYYIKDKFLALKYAKEANILSKKINNSIDYLESLKLLSKLDKKNSDIYLNRYIQYNDSLIATERKTLDKFTRIEFETDEIQEQNERLTQQQIWILFVSSALILALVFVYFLKVQKAKNEKLILETEQQKANEQVYLLTLKQQATLEEERTRERNRISQELHDGILGRLFGTRVGMGFLDIDADEETKKQHESFLEELQDIEKEIREVSHKLNTNFDSADVNFTNIINQLLESKSQIGDFQFQLNIDSNISWKSTDEIIKVNVYRIIQEALQNTIKHAKANHVSIEFFTDKSYLNILLKDDGVGFNLKKSKKGIGLKNIQSRVQNMKGTLDIKSAMNEGTLIHIKIPIEQP